MILSRVKIYAALAAVALLVVLFGWTRLQAQRIDLLTVQRDSATEQSQMLAGKLRAMGESRARERQILQAREIERGRLYAEVNRLKRNLNRLEAENEDVRRWATAAVPDAVLSELRAGEDGDGP